jgi:hypothetical protein
MKKNGLISLLLVIALALTWPAAQAQRNGGPSASSSPRGNPEYITAAQLQDYLYFIASDEMEGRNTPSRGLDITAKFIGTLLSRWGLKPVGDDGTFFQRIALKQTKLDGGQTRLELNGQTFSFGDEFIPQAAAGSASGQLVYASHGWVVKSKNINAYEGIDVRDKIVIISGNGFQRPAGVSNVDTPQGKQGEEWDSPQTYLARNGAKGVINLPSATYLSNWAISRAALERGGGFTVEKLAPRGGPRQQVSGLPSLTASEKLAKALFQGEKLDAATLLKNVGSAEPGASFALSPSKQISFTVSVKTDTVHTQNVVGVLEGSDRTLKNEYVAIGAHYDHVGTGAPDRNGDTISNGADDDGSGTTATLAMAEAFAKGARPKRSILFVWHAGEEKGLWGSEYINEFPVVPLNQIITQLNIDMIGRSKKEGDTNQRNAELSGPNEVYVIGSKMMSTELGELSERINNSYLKLSFNYKYDDPNDRNRFFFRSDHYNYAKKGIPIIFYFTGVHEDYHQRSVRLITRRWRRSHAQSTPRPGNWPMELSVRRWISSYRRN